MVSLPAPVRLLAPASVTLASVVNGAETPVERATDRQRPIPLRACRQKVKLDTVLPVVLIKN